MRSLKITMILWVFIGILNAQDVIWEKTFGGSNDDVAYAVSVLPDGNIILAGVAGGTFGAGGWDVYVIKIDKNGNKIWQKTFGGSKDEWAYAVSVLPDGNIILGGETESFGAGKEDVYVLKLNAK